MKTVRTLSIFFIAVLGLLVMNSFHSTTRTKSGELNCDSFKTGTFELNSKKYGKSSIIRTSTEQIETAPNGEKEFYSINWIDNNTYVLQNKKQNTPELVNDIIEVKENSYKVRCHYKGSDDEYYFEISKSM